MEGSEYFPHLAAPSCIRRRLLYRKRLLGALRWSNSSALRLQRYLATQQKAFSMWPRALFIVVCVFLVGCSSNSPFDYVKASGKISYEDGSLIPAGGMELRFSAL